MADHDDRERTLVILKPDAVHRSLIGEIISRFERKGLRIVAMKMIHIDRPLAELHYAEHKGKPFYEDLLAFITSGPSVVMMLEGRQAVGAVRRIMGATNHLDAAPGTIRADLAMHLTYNLIHGSDSLETARREIGLFFQSHDVVSYPDPTQVIPFV